MKEAPPLLGIEDAPVDARRLGDAEAWARRRGFLRVAGVDEAGRGPLAGAVVAACVVLDPDRPPPDGLDDSKRLTPARRAALEPEIRSVALSFGVASVGPRRIDEINILQATLEAMAEALDQLTLRPDIVLVDGTVPFPCELPLECLVKGDQRSFNVAAASVLAKVERDRQLELLEERYPGYGFARHKGYPTAEHKAALRRLGPTPEHRLSFRGVR